MIEDNHLTGGGSVRPAKLGNRDNTAPGALLIHRNEPSVEAHGGDSIMGHPESIRKVPGQ